MSIDEVVLLIRTQYNTAWSDGLQGPHGRRDSNDRSINQHCRENKEVSIGWFKIKRIDEWRFNFTEWGQQTGCKDVGGRQSGSDR